MDLERMMQSLGPIQDALRQQQAEQAQCIIEGRAGGGAVSIRLRGNLEVEAVSIAAAAASAAGEDASMLEDLIHSALNDALRQYQQRFGSSPEEQLQKQLGGSDIGSLLGPLMGQMGQ